MKPRKHDMSEAVLFVLFVILLVVWFATKADADVRYKEHVAGIDTNKAVKKMQKERETEMKNDIDLMAHLIYAENGDESYDEYVKAMTYTGSVVLNRMHSNKFPDDLEGVIYQSGQYACTWDGGINKNPSADAYKVASKLLRSGSKLPQNVLYAAEFVQGKIYDKVAGTYYCY